MESSFNIHPNPATNSITIDAKQILEGNINVRIINIGGMEMLNDKFLNPDKIVLDVSNLMPGMYFVEISNPEGREVKKLIIQ